MTWREYLREAYHGTAAGVGAQMLTLAIIAIIFIGWILS